MAGQQRQPSGGQRRCCWPTRLGRCRELPAYVYEALRAGASGFMLTCGLSNPEICERLVISEATAKTHVARILAKLDLRDRVQAVIYAYETGLISPGTAAGEQPSGRPLA